MDREASLDLSARIGALIAERSPVVEYTDDDVRLAEAECADDLAEMRELGLIRGSFGEYYVIREFCARYGIADEADGHYLLRLFAEARMLDADEFLRDPYLQNISIPTVSDGGVLRVRTQNWSPDHVYVKAVYLNGIKLKGTTLQYEDIKDGAELLFVMQ